MLDSSFRATPTFSVIAVGKDAVSKERGGLHYPIGRKVTNRKVTEKVKQLVLDLISKQVSVLGTTNVERNGIF